MPRWSTCCVLLAAIAAAPDAANAQETARPNFLLILADDHAYEAVGAMGNSEVETPAIDRLASQGITFTHTYNQGGWSGAICVASRTMLNTGRYLWNAHRISDQTEQERAEGRFWSEYMKDAGYDTYFTGKWHVRAKAEEAFDHTGHVRGGMPRQTPAGYNRPLPGQDDPWSPWDPEFGGFWEGGRHWSEVVADETIGFLQQAAESDRPFFMYVAFNAPHDPRQAPRDYVERYPVDQVQVPESFAPVYPYAEAIGCGPRLRDARLAPFPRTEHSVRVHRREYYAIISHMDAQIARILEALEETGKREQTYIIFTADHGLAVGHHGLIGKQNMYDHSVRVPFMMVGPGIPAGESRNQPIYLQDVMPTTLELAGIERPDHVEFHSLLPLVESPDARSYDAVYGAYLELQRMVTADGFKLILYPPEGVARLYHLAEDPQELNDLAGDPKFHPVAVRLFEKLQELQQETGDELDLSPVYGERFGSP